MMIELTELELALIVEALDSHAYWQLSDPRYRDSGYVLDPGSDDEEAAEEIAMTNALQERLAEFVRVESG